jgi:hypothetical protein
MFAFDAIGLSGNSRKDQRIMIHPAGASKINGAPDFEPGTQACEECAGLPHAAGISSVPSSSFRNGAIRIVDPLCPAGSLTTPFLSRFGAMSIASAAESGREDWIKATAIDLSAINQVAWFSPIWMLQHTQPRPVRIVKG